MPISDSTTDYRQCENECLLENRAGLIITALLLRRIAVRGDSAAEVVWTSHKDAGCLMIDFLTNC